MTPRRPRAVASRRRAVTRPALAAALTLTVSAVGLPQLAPQASAAAPTPSVRSFGAAIDPLASYVGQTECDPTAKPGPVAVKKLLDETYGTQSANIPRSCSDGGGSEHKEGRAIDWMVSARNATQKARAEAFLGWLKATDSHGNRYAMVRRLGVMYVIWNGRMWRAYDPTRGGGTGWTEYSSCLTSMTSQSYDTTCHRDHVHISFSWEGAAALTSYYSDRVLPARCPDGSTGAAPSLSTAGHGFVPVTQRRIANTGSGYGLPAPCRLEAGRRFDVAVTGRGGVPSSGVHAVALNVTVSRATRGTTVTAWPAGASKPSSVTVATPWGTTRGGATVVPVGADGRVAFALSSGTAEVSVDVLGYYPAGGGYAYTPAAQQRVLDLTVDPDARRTVTLGGTAGLPPSGIRGAVVGVTAVSPEAGGGLAAWSADGAVSAPGVPALVVHAGRTSSGRVMVPTTSAGAFVLHNRTSRPLRVLVDTVGFFSAAGSGGFTPADGRKVLDTRTDLGVTGSFTAGRSAAFPVVGRGVPAGARVAVLQVVSFTPSADTRLTVWASGTSRPYAAAAYPRQGETSAAVVLAPVGVDGKVAMYNRSGTAHVGAHLLGYVR